MHAPPEPAPMEHCPIQDLIEIIGGRWKPFILWWLQDEPRRFGALARLIPAITQKMLTQQLRELERDGLVSRKIYPEVPPRVEYSLTALGVSLRDVLQAMCHWSTAHLAEVGEARARADRNRPQRNP